MKQRSFFLFLFLIFAACTKETDQTETESYTEIDPIVTNDFDPELAAEVGADEYGMRTYIMAFLKKGPNRDLSEEEAASLQNAHMENIGKMAEAGKLAIAGPFLDDGDLRGIYIFNVGTIEEAEELTNSDPAIKAGSLIMELRPWYGSAGLMKVGEIHERVSKEKI